MMHYRPTSLESLPKQFVSAMRTLFDIMDDKQTGYVKLTDIENRWRDDRTKGLPRGVIESLQKVASHDGLLTFESFCTGLKICLLQNHAQNAKVNAINADVDNSVIRNQISQMSRPPSAPLIDIDNDNDRDTNWNLMRVPTNSNQRRTNSMPQLIEDKDYLNKEKDPIPKLLQNDNEKSVSKPNASQGLSVYGPPKPPRLEKNASDRKDVSRIVYKTDDMFLESNNMGNSKLDFQDCMSQSLLDGQGRGLGDGRSAIGTQTTLRKASRRREPRRHTLHNGVDYNLIKRMKQIEQEKDVLLQGLSAVEEAREWYLKQLAEVQDKMRYAGRMGAYIEPWNEAHQERIELLKARVLELNRQLGALAAGWRHGPLSLHMNLALPTTMNTMTAAPNNANVLRSQNRMLAEEVNRKNERITVLEREKSALIRELLLQRNRTKLMESFS
ncbi:suppressor APC domain-containing protein 2 [Danaus plexippus]|uniref:suppressor APC domain-containing protein 2 n=1 Tax=Danaus plexippus TaxID=13037 RepID=UPI002AB05D6C|nr:suppressor APC domain-containing protein 2 [Danaus plexippus]